MRFVLATNHLLGWTGSEITVATLAGVLDQAGHDVLVYAPFIGDREITKALLGSVPATSQLADVASWAPDAAYTQHHPVVTAVRSALPNCPIAHALLGVLPHLEKPPARELGIEVFLAISEEVADLAVASGVAQERVQIFRNLVDDAVFDGPIAGPLHRIVSFSYKLRGGQLELLRSVAATRDLELVDCTPIRPGATPYAEVPALIRQGEIVVSSGRGAIEAMLCGRVPLILADCGDDGLVTPANFDFLIRCNFSGRAMGSNFDGAGLAAEIDQYHAEVGHELRRLARHHLGVSERRQSILQMFESLATSVPPEIPLTQLRAIDFELRTLLLQREFAKRIAQDLATPAPDEGAAADASQSLERGHLAMRRHDHENALEHYLRAFRGDVPSTASGRSLASVVLVQLALREKHSRNVAGQRQALEAFLALNPGNSWAGEQLSGLGAAQ